MATIVGKLLNQEFIGIAQFVVGHILDIKVLAGEMLYKLTKHLVGQTFLVGPIGIAKDALQLLGIDFLYFVQSLVDGLAYIDRGTAHLVPMCFGRYLETVILIESCIFQIAIAFLQGFFVFLIVHIANALVEQEREDVLLIVAGINETTKIGGGSP